MTQVVIYGAGGFARELAWLLQRCNHLGDEKYKINCFIDDNETNHGKILNGIPVMELEGASRQFPEAKIIGGVGTPRTREILMKKAESAGFKSTTIVHPETEISNWVHIGLGTVVCAGNILTTNIILGRHCQINLDCTIGHDVVMGDFATLAPGVHVSGYVHLGRRTYVGTGAVIVNGTEKSPIIIGDDAVIGAGACVTRSVGSGQIVVGIPAKPVPEL